jgi:Asp-tRNA(Asn)/Glu-tRNA(Gln) amidotransferase A subunit family amidase
MTNLDLAYRTAGDLARMIRSKQLSPTEVMENTLGRIETVNPTLNCFCFVYPEEALEYARAVENKVMAGGDPGPLGGIPIAIKDLTPTKGKRTTLGSYAYEHWVPEADAAIVEKLMAAGAIMVGKTTTPEFAHVGFTESALWGITRNPWDPARTPGGSSGGSAAAVASGCVPLAEGTDMGGSVRIPAAECGVLGLKPSLGRIPMDILPSVFDNISHFGSLARSVDDTALFLAVTQGPDERDIQSNGTPLDLADPIQPDVRGPLASISASMRCTLRSKRTRGPPSMRFVNTVPRLRRLCWTGAKNSTRRGPRCGPFSWPLTSDITWSVGATKWTPRSSSSWMPASL